MSSVTTFQTEVRKMWESGEKEFGSCGYCDEMISRRDVGRNDVALDVENKKLYHSDCCPCQSDQRELNGRWQQLVVHVDQNRYEFVGSLTRCPFCFRVFDDDGVEVKL